MKIKLSKNQWEYIGKTAGWMDSDEGKLNTMRDDLKEQEEINTKIFNGKPILNPENAVGENLYEIQFGSVVNTGLIGFDGYVFAFDEQEAVDRILDKYPNLGISEEDLSNYDQDSISYGGNNGIPYASEDLRGLKLVRKQ